MNAKWLVSPRLGLLLGVLAVVAVASMALTQRSVQGAAPAKKEAVLQFSVAMTGDPDFDLLRVAEIVDAIRKGANIGSSGQDGFATESFFDITYRQGTAPDGTATNTVDVEIHAQPNNPAMNPGQVIDNVAAALGRKGKELTGHVTLIK